MRYRPLVSIQVSPDRQRQFFDPERLAELQSSIERIGLIQPLVVAEDGTLVAGERRLKSLSALHMLGCEVRFNGEVIPADTAPCLLPSEADAVMLFEIELEENIRRHDLTWQEQAEATRRLAEFRRQQATAQSQPLPTTADLSEEITGRRDGAYQEQTRRQLIVSQHLGDKDVAKAKSVDEAFKILKRKEQAAGNVALAEQQGTRAVTDRHQVFNANCIEWGWQYLDDGNEKFDLLITDPPYGMDAQDFGDAGGAYAGITHSYADDRKSWEGLMTEFASLSFYITRPDSHLYCFCDIDGFHFLREAFTLAGWRVHRTPLVMRKLDANRVPWPQHGPRRSYELVLYAIKGNRPINSIYSDVFETTGDENLGHGAQKPIAAWADLLKRSARPGDRILDPFAGTGGLMVAAHNAGCDSILVERDAGSYGICLKRLEGLK